MHTRTGGMFFCCGMKTYSHSRGSGCLLCTAKAWLLEGVENNHCASRRGFIEEITKMPDIQALVNDFVNKLRKRKIEGSQATARHTAELLRSVISQHRIPYTNQAGALINVVKAVGQQLIAANPVELAIGNIIRRVLHIIREEDLSLATAVIGDLNISVGSDDDDGGGGGDDIGDHPVLSAAAARSTCAHHRCRLFLKMYLMQLLLPTLLHLVVILKGKANVVKLAGHLGSHIF